MGINKQLMGCTLLEMFSTAKLVIEHLENHRTKPWINKNSNNIKFMSLLLLITLKNMV